MTTDDKDEGIKLTREERNLIKALRSCLMSHGRIPCVIYVQDGKMVRVEIERPTSSVMLTEK